MNSIASYLGPEDIRLDADIASKPELIETVARHMEQAHALPHDRVFQGLTRREQLGSTGLGLGVAIPHARVRDLERILAAYLRLKAPIPYGAPDNAPVSDILVLLVPKQATEEHLTILAEAAQMFSEAGSRERLHQCGDPSSVKQLFETWAPSPE